jgi:mono/diheme cytochrome c family protein
VEGAIARGQLRLDRVLYTGFDGDAPSAEFPFPITREDMLRGRERFNIFCSPCHSELGDGNGMVVRRGFRQARNFHTEQMRNAPPGHFFDVITNGFGAMPPYGSRVPPEDRWRIAAYIRALQLSQNATPGDVPPDQRAALENAP